MKEGWKTVTIESLFSSIRNGANIQQSKDAAGIPITRIETLANGVFNDNRLGYANIEDSSRYEQYILHEGDILMSHINSLEHIGRSVVFHNSKFPIIIHGMNLLRLVPNNNIDSDYCAYYFKTKNFRKDILGITHKSVNQASFNTRNLKSLVVPLPPLSEQQRIVAYLDAAFAKIDALKAKAKENLDNAQALFQAALTEMLTPKEGWEISTFGKTCSYHKEHTQEPGLKYIGLEHIESATGILLGTIPSDNVLSNNFKFSKGEVLYGRLRPYLKKVIVADFDGCCSTEIFPIKSSKLNSSFLKYWLLTDEITDKINATSAGCRMPRGNMNEVLKFDISYPSLSEQEKIVFNLDAISEKVKTLQSNYTTLSASCDTLKQSLLRQVFE